MLFHLLLMISFSFIFWLFYLSVVFRNWCILYINIQTNFCFLYVLLTIIADFKEIEIRLSNHTLMLYKFSLLWLATILIRWNVKMFYRENIINTKNVNYSQINYCMLYLIFKKVYLSTTLCYCQNRLLLICCFCSGLRKKTKIDKR